MGLTKLAINRPLTVLMMLFGIVLMGAVSYTYLKIDRLPPISVPFVSVSVSYPGASAEDVETLITIPIENTLSGMEGVNQISSTSSEGRSNVNIQLAEGRDGSTAAVEVSRRLASLRARLPADAGEPTVNRADPNAQPIMNVALTGAPLDQLFELAETQIQPELQSVLGVAQVTISGGLQREIQVRFEYSRLAAYGVSAQQIQQALSSANVTSPVGTLQQGGQRMDVRAVGRFETVEELQNLIITQTTAGPILLRDVASVKEAYREQTQFQRLNGQDAVGFTIVKQSDANALQVADDVRSTLENLKPLLPAGSVVKITNDTSVFTRSALHAIQKDLALAMLLVGAVMLLFLHEWKHTIIVLLSIPTSMISSFFVMYLMGFTLNVVTLMALALMIGILVDDSIVVLENIHRHMQAGEGPMRAALTGRNEIAMAALAITLADVVVYLPIGFLPGTLGQIFRQYALTVVTATLFSLLVGFTLTPMLASRWLSHETGTRGPLAAFGRVWDAGFARLANFVGYIVPAAVRIRWIIVALGIMSVAFAASMIPLRLIGTEYSPQEDDSNFQVGLNLAAGTSLETVDQAARQMEGMLMAIPEVTDVFTTVSVGGGGGGFGGGSGGRASYAVQTVPKHDRHRSVFDITQEVRTMGRQIPGANVSASVASPLGGGGGGFGGGGGNNISVQLRGPEPEVLNVLAEQLIATALTVPGIGDMRNNSSAASPELRVAMNHQRMAELGVTAQQVANAVRTTFSGATLGQLRPPGRLQQNIVLIANDVDRNNPTSLLSIPVGGGGASANPIITLGQVATLERGTGPLQIQRVDRNRTMTLSGAIVGRPLGDVAPELQARLAEVPLPPGYSIRQGGQVNQLNNALRSLGQALALSLLLEYMLLVALYESWFYPFVRLCAVPLGLVGAFLALWMTQNTLNIFSIIGLIMAEGLVAKNGILLIDYTNQLRQRGMGRLEALAEASRVRLRPILMTSATLVFGLLPLALKLEEGGESRAPTAVVVIGAIISSTILTLLVIPSIYTLFDDLQAFVSRRGRRVAQPVPALAVAGVGTSVAAEQPIAADPVAPGGNGHTNGGANGSGAAAATGGRPLLAGLRARLRGERPDQ